MPTITEDIKENIDVEFSKVVDIIARALPSIESAANTELVPLIGGTGSGKSALLNYLHGSKYAIAYDDSGHLFATWCGGATEIYKVGQSIISETYFPQLVKNIDSECMYTDLAGLVDSRGYIARVCAANTAQVLKNKASGIKAILVILDLPAFLALNGEAFKQTAISLAVITRNEPALLQSVRFLVTKTPPGQAIKPEAIVNKYIKSILVGQDGLENMAKDRLLSTTEQALLDMLRLMQKNPNHIIVVNIADNGESRIKIEREIQTLESIKVANYDFQDFATEQRNFNTKLCVMAKEFIQTKERIEKGIPKDILKLESEMSVALAKLDQERLDIRRNIKEQSESKLQIKFIERDIEELQQKVTKLKLCYKLNTCQACANDIEQVYGDIVEKEGMKAEYASKVGMQSATEHKLKVHNVTALYEGKIRVLQNESNIFVKYLADNYLTFKQVERISVMLDFGVDSTFEDFWREMLDYDHKYISTEHNKQKMRL